MYHIPTAIVNFVLLTIRIDETVKVYPRCKCDKINAGRSIRRVGVSRPVYCRPRRERHQTRCQSASGNSRREFPDTSALQIADEKLTLAVFLVDRTRWKSIRHADAALRGTCKRTVEDSLRGWSASVHERFRSAARQECSQTFGRTLWNSERDKIATRRVIWWEDRDRVALKDRNRYNCRLVRPPTGSDFHYIVAKYCVITSRIINTRFSI